MRLFFLFQICDRIFRFIDKNNDGVITPQQIIEVIGNLTNIK